MRQLACEVASCNVGQTCDLQNFIPCLYKLAHGVIFLIRKCQLHRLHIIFKNKLHFTQIKFRIILLKILQQKII